MILFADLDGAARLPSPARLGAEGGIEDGVVEFDLKPTR